MIESLFAELLKKHSLNEIYEMDILGFLRLINRESEQTNEVIKTDSLFSAFGK